MFSDENSNACSMVWKLEEEKEGVHGGAPAAFFLYYLLDTISTAYFNRPPHGNQHHRCCRSMELPGGGLCCNTAVVSISLFLLPFAFFFFFLLRSRPEKNGSIPPPPPSPPSLPVLGHLHLLKPPLPRTLTDLSRGHGAPVLLLRLGTRRALVVSSPAAAEECFTTNDVVFASRPLASQVLSYGNTTITTAPYGQLWRDLGAVRADPEHDEDDDGKEVLRGGRGGDGGGDEVPGDSGGVAAPAGARQQLGLPAVAPVGGPEGGEEDDDVAEGDRDVFLQKLVDVLLSL